MSGTLFTIAINGMFEGIEKSFGKCLYPDNLALFYLAKATEMIKRKMHPLVERFSFSAIKTTCVHFCQNQGRFLDPMLTVNGVPRYYKPEIKLLGLNFDRHLTWNAHFEDLAERCKSSLNAIRCTYHIFGEQIGKPINLTSAMQNRI